MGSGDELDKETEDLLSMLGPAEPEPAKPEPPKAGGPQEARGLTALLDDLDDAALVPEPAGKLVKPKRSSSTERETTPMRSPTAQGVAPAPSWPLETQSDASPPAMPDASPPSMPDATPKRPKTDSSTYPRVDNAAEPEPAFDEPLDPDLPRPTSPVFEPGFTPPPEPTSKAPLRLDSEVVEPGPDPKPAPDPDPVVGPQATADDPESAAAAADAALVRNDPLAQLRAAQSKKPRTMLWVGIISFAAAGLGAVVYTQADAFHPERDKTRSMVAEDEKERALAEHQRKQPVEGTLLIESSEPEVAVWLKLGRTPVQSLDVASNQVHEVRYELAGFKTIDDVISRQHWVTQGDAQSAKHAVTLQPGSESAPSYPPQSAVRPAPGPDGKGPMVLGSTPPGAEVWLLIGFTPGVKFTGAQVGRRYEIKLLKDGFRPSFAAVTERDWMLGDREVRVDVKLSALVADKRRKR